MQNNTKNSLVGLIPAAGKASRIQPIPCSKELLPIGSQSLPDRNGKRSQRPKVVSQYLLERMSAAGAKTAYMVISRGKWDIPAYFGPGTLAGVDLAYVVTETPYGAPFSLKQAFPFAADATILFGFPDIRFSPGNAFARLLQKKEESGADLVLGLFKAADPSKMDMVRLDRHGEIEAIEIKPQLTDLTHTWILAVWSPLFTGFMADYLESVEPGLADEYRKAPRGEAAEFYVGHVIQAALKDTIKTANVVFEQGDYIDIGTPESLASAMTRTERKGVGRKR